MFEVFTPHNIKRKILYSREWPLSKKMFICPTCGSKVLAFKCKLANDCMSCKHFEPTKPKLFKKKTAICKHPENKANLSPDVINPNNDCMLYEKK